MPQNDDESFSSLLNGTTKSVPEPQPNEGDSFSSLLNGTGTGSKLAAAQNLGKGTSPEDAGKVISTAAKTGLPTPFVKDNLKDLQDQGGVDPHAYAKSSPDSAEWTAQDPNRAAASRNSFQQHADLESAIRKVGSMEQLSNGLDATIDKAIAGTFRAPGYVLKGLAGVFDITHSDFLDSLTNNAMTKRMDAVAGEEEKGSPIMNPEADGWNQDMHDKKYGEVALKMASTVTNFIPKIVPWIAGPEVGIPADVASSAGESGKEAEDKGANSAQQGAVAIGHGILTAALDKMFMSGPMESFLKKSTAAYGQDATKQVIKQSVAATFKHTLVNAPAGAVGSYGDDLVDRIYNPDAFKGSNDRALTGAIQMSALGIGIHASAAMLGHVNREFAVSKAASASDAYSTIGDLAKKSYLNNISPEGFSSLVQALVKKSKVDSIYIPREAWEAYAEKNNLSPMNAAKELGIDYHMTLNTGVDMKADYATWLTKTLKTEHYDAFKNDMKFDKNGFTVNELKAPEPKEQSKPDEKNPVQKALSSIQDFLGIKPKETVAPKPDEPAGTFKSGDSSYVSNDEFIKNRMSEWRKENKGASKSEESKQEQKFLQDAYNRNVDDTEANRSLKAKENLDEVFNVVKPLFENPEHFLPGDKAEKYKALLTEAPKVAAKIVTDRELKQREWKATKDAKTSEKIFRKSVTDQYESDKSVIAKSVLETGKMPNGDKAPASYRDGVSEKTLKQIKDFHKEFKKTSPEANAEGFKGNAKDLDTIVDLTDAAPGDSRKLNDLSSELGFGSIYEMLEASARAPERDIIDQAVENALEQLHDQEPEYESHQEILIDAIHDENFSEIKYQELKHVRDMIFADPKMRREMVGLISKKMKAIGEFKSEAEDGMGKLIKDQTSSIQHARAGARAGNEARKLLLSGDLRGAFDKKQEELVNHYSYKSAKTQELLSKRSIKFVKTLDRTSVRKNLGAGLNDSLGQVDAIRKRFELPGKKFQEPDTDIKDWYDYARELDKNLSLPDVVLSGASKDFNKLSNDDFNSVIDSLRAIKTIGNNVGKFLSEHNEASIQSNAEYVADKMASERQPIKKQSNQVAEKTSIKIKQRLRAWDADMLKVPDFIQMLDHDGVLTRAHELLIKPVRESEAREHQLRSDLHSDLTHLNNLFTRPERVDNQFKDIFIKDAKMKDREVNVGSEKKPDMVDVAAHDGNFSRQNLQHLAMYAGDQYAHDEFVKGNGITEERLQFWLDGRLDKRDVEVINKKHEIEEKLFQHQVKLEMQNTGVMPKTTLARPYSLKLKDGTTVQMKGGHAQVRLRGDFSKPVEGNEKITNAFGNQYGRPNTNQWNLESRTGTNGHTMDYTDASWVNAKLKQIKDISFRNTVRDIDQLMHNDTFTNSIKTYMGKEYIDMINDWNERLSGKKDYEPVTGLDMIRSRTLAADIGGSVGAALKHIANTGIAVNYLGEHFFSAYKDLYQDPTAITAKFKEVNYLLPFLSRRFGADTNMSDFIPEGSKDTLKNFVFNNPQLRNACFSMIKGMDQVTATPIAWGAYKKAMAEGLPKNGIKPGDHDASVAYAEEITKRAKGSSDLSDQAKWQVANSWAKLFSMFMSPMSVVYNNMRLISDKYVVDKKFGELCVGLAYSAGIGVLGRMALDANKQKEEDAGTKAMLSSVNYFADMIPYASPFINYGESALLNNKPFDFEGSAASGEVAKAVVGAVNIVKDLNGDKVAKEGKWDTDRWGYEMELPSLAFGAPINTMVRTLQQ